MKYGYARVSTKMQSRDGNSLEAQEQALKEAGAEIIYKDSFTGMKGSRPELDKLLAVIEEGDTLIVTKLWRLARSAAEGIQLIETLLEQGIIVHVLNMGVMDSSPTGKLIRNVMMAFGEFERDIIVERTREGKEIAKLNPNFREGRPKKFKKAQLEHALELMQYNTTKQVSEMTGISEATLYRYKREIIKQYSYVSPTYLVAEEQQRYEGNK